MDDEAMRERVRELRLGGASCRQIAEALGLTQSQAEHLVRRYLAWLRLLGVIADRLRLHLQIHESADVSGADPVLD